MCYKNFIGLTKKCNLDAPTSGLYIDMLEGISMKSVANIAMGDAITAQALIDEKTQLVFEKLKSGSYPFLFENVIDHSVESIISKGFEDGVIPASTNERGVRIETKRGSLTKLVVERIYLLSETDVQGLEVVIRDGTQATKTIEIDLEAAKEKVVELNYTTSSTKVDITYENNGLVPFTGDISPWNRYYYKGCNSCGCNGMKIVSLDGGVEGSSWIGLRADTSLQCDREKMVCLVANIAKVAILYLVGSEVMKEHYSSDRVNFLSINGKEMAKEKAMEFLEEGEKVLDNNSQGITKYLSSAQKECFICNTVQYGYSLP